MRIDLKSFKKSTNGAASSYGGLLATAPGSCSYSMHDHDGTFYGVVLKDGERWVCEIDDLQPSSRQFGCLACWQGNTPREALAAALVEVAGETLAEPAADLGRLARETAKSAFALASLGRDRWTETPEREKIQFRPETDEEREAFDSLLVAANRYVSRRFTTRKVMAA